MPRGLSLSQFDAVLFDVDGTLVDSLEMIVRGLGDAFERYAQVRPSDEEILRHIGRPLTAQLGFFTKEEPTPQEIGEMTSFAIRRFEEYEEHERLFPAAVETLRLCHRQGLGTALVTSKTTPELEGFMRRFEAADSVKITVCASDVISPKPHPESALRACELLGVPPSRAVMIGDSIYDIRCAKDAGVASVGVAYGAGLRDDLRKEQPDLLLDKPEELLAWAQSAFLETTCRERS